ncbi:MAG: sigma-54-dependent Fis family transcriptional regulator [Gemmatimonadetes bacterium]|nr:sigma-54-dependent Fis family transcriptional regulator [Gemmatimonadota bacterium]
MEKPTARRGDRSAAQGTAELTAKSAGMRRLLEVGARVAGSDATVLITGESGTGKERLAHFIHQRSRRAGGPFLAINCGALPESLLESELFGHVRGAFTGASSDKKGLFEAATGGSLFLDEIGETSGAVQVKLLRALQEHSVRPVGSTRDVRVDARIIAATNRDLESMVRERTFRKDLFYRLKVIPLEVPPLRDRREDILALARQFIDRACVEHACGPCSLSAEVLDLLIAYDWPGNVRELQNAIERAVILAEGKPRIEPADLPPEVRGQPVRRWGNAEGDQILALEEVERRHIIATLERLGGSRRQAARALGIGENTLWRKLKSYGMVRTRPQRQSGRLPGIESQGKH